MTALKWHWQQDKWPNFTYEKEALLGLELAFIQSSAMALGALKHVSDEEKDQLLVEVLSDEAMRTSEMMVNLYQTYDEPLTNEYLLSS